MSHSRNNNLISSEDEDLDPTGEGLVYVQAPEGTPQKLPETSKAVGFNSFRLTLNARQPVKLIGHDPARLRMLLNISANVDVYIGDQSSVTNLQGFNLTNHNSGGSIQIDTTEEIWVILDSATASDTVIVYVWIERSVSN
jgi:hypothetical protein